MRIYPTKDVTHTGNSGNANLQDAKTVFYCKITQNVWSTYSKRTYW